MPVVKSGSVALTIFGITHHKRPNGSIIAVVDLWINKASITVLFRFQSTKDSKFVILSRNNTIEYWMRLTCKWKRSKKWWPNLRTKNYEIKFVRKENTYKCISFIGSVACMMHFISEYLALLCKSFSIIFISVHVQVRNIKWT